MPMTDIALCAALESVIGDNPMVTLLAGDRVLHEENRAFIFTMSVASMAAPFTFELDADADRLTLTNASGVVVLDEVVNVPRGVTGLDTIRIALSDGVGVTHHALWHQQEAASTNWRIG